MSSPLASLLSVQTSQLSTQLRNGLLLDMNLAAAKRRGTIKAIILLSFPSLFFFYKIFFQLKTLLLC